MSFTAAAYSYDCCYSKQVCLQCEINVLIYNPWKSQKKQVKTSLERECRNERDSKYREQGLSCFGMSLYWENGNGRNWNMSGRARPWRFPPDPIQRMPAGMEEGQGSERPFLDLLFQRGSISIRNWDEKSHLTFRSLPTQPIP